MLTTRRADDPSTDQEGTLSCMNAKFRVVAISLALVVVAGLVLLLVRPGHDPARIRPLALLIGAWLAFITAAWLLRKVPLRASVVLIVLGGIAVPLAPGSAPPQNSNDLYRYIWDGRVQAAGVDPYQYVPTARQLTGLRDEFLFHPRAEYCITQAYVSHHPAAELAAGCTAINRPTAGPPQLPAGRRGVLPRGPFPAIGQQLDQADPGDHGAGGRAHHRAAAVRPETAAPGHTHGCAVVLVSDGGPGGRQQRPRGRGRGRDRRGRDPGAGHRTDHAPDDPGRGPARPGRRDQADARAGRAGLAAAPLVHRRRRREQRVHRGLRPAPARGRQQGDRVPARLPAAGELHHRDQVRDHRPARHRPAGLRPGGSHPGRGRSGRPAVR